VFCNYLTYIYDCMNCLYIYILVSKLIILNKNMFSQHENTNKKDNIVQVINFIPGKKIYNIQN
jgi:hypothetical protein